MIGKVSKDVTQHGKELAQHATGALDTAVNVVNVCVDSHIVEGITG